MKYIPYILSLFIVSNLYSSTIADTITNSKSADKLNDLFADKTKQFSSIDLKSLGLDGLDYDNVANVNMSAFKGFLSNECEIPLIPQIPDDFCSDLFKGNFKFMENLNLGLCTIGIDSTKGTASDLSKKKDGYVAMATQMCENGAGKVNSFSRWANKKITGASAETMDVLAPVSDVKVKSEFTEEKNIKLNDYTLPNGKKHSDIVKPNGVLGFDKIYTHDEKIPNSVRDAYFRNDYQTYNIYERHAKVATPSKDGSIDFKNIPTDVPETYLDYMQEVQVGTKETFTSLPTVYEYDKQLNNEFNKIQKSNPLKLDSSKSSIEMKADYIAYKKELSEKFMDINSETSSLKKMQDSIGNYENTKFMENEENYRIKNNYIIQPSKLKLETIPTGDRVLYADKIRKQQEEEIRRGAEFLRESKNKKELAKLMAEKVFISNFEFSSEISQKEIEEILTQANAQ